MKAEECSTAALAYLGDCVWELCARTKLVREGLSHSKTLNKEALSLVSAPAQAAAMERLLPHLSEAESAVFHRGRNMGHGATPRHATVAQYRNATGLEALFGYLYLTGEQARIDALFALAFEEEIK